MLVKVGFDCLAEGVGELFQMMYGGVLLRQSVFLLPRFVFELVETLIGLLKFFLFLFNINLIVLARVLQLGELHLHLLHDSQILHSLGKLSFLALIFRIDLGIVGFEIAAAVFSRLESSPGSSELGIEVGKHGIAHIVFHARFIEGLFKALDTTFTIEPESLLLCERVAKAIGLSLRFRAGVFGSRQIGLT